MTPEEKKPKDKPKLPTYGSMKAIGAVERFERSVDNYSEKRHELSAQECEAQAEILRLTQDEAELAATLKKRIADSRKLLEPDPGSDSGR